MRNLELHSLRQGQHTLGGPSAVVVGANTSDWAHSAVNTLIANRATAYGIMACG